MRQRAEKRDVVQVAAGELAALHRRIAQLEEENVGLRRLAQKSGSLASRYSLGLAEQLLRARAALRHQARAAALAEQAWDRVRGHLFDVERLTPRLPEPAQAALAAHQAALRQLVAQAEREAAEAGFLRVADMAARHHADEFAAKELTRAAVDDFGLVMGAAIEDDAVPVAVREAFYALLDFSLQLCEMVDKTDKARFRGKLQPLLNEHLARLRDRAQALRTPPPRPPLALLPGPVYLRCELRNASQPSFMGPGLAGLGAAAPADDCAPSQLLRLGRSVAAAFETAEELKNLLGGPGTPPAAAHLLARLLQALNNSRPPAALP